MSSSTLRYGTDINTVTAADSRAMNLKNAAKPSMASSPREAVTSRPANDARANALPPIVASATASSTPSRRGTMTDSNSSSKAPPVSTISGRM